MSNVNSTEFGKLYQFLANRGDGWLDEANGKDENLVYSEFYNYVKMNWDGTGCPDADIIHEFFKFLDKDITGRVGVDNRLTDKGVLAGY